MDNPIPIMYEHLLCTAPEAMGAIGVAAADGPAPVLVPVPALVPAADVRDAVKRIPPPSAVEKGRESPRIPVNAPPDRMRNEGYHVTI